MRVLITLICGVLMIARPEDVPAPFAPWAPLDLSAEPNFVTGFKVKRVERDGPACAAVLSSGGVSAPLVPDLEVSADCHIRTAVRPARLGKARITPETMRCGIALRLALWERHDLQPEAQRLFGTDVAEIRHFGAYSCRAMRTSAGESTRMSQHATANAFDISGFVLADGRTVDLKRDWKGDGPKAAFLRAARDGLCARFRVVLGPDYNALHADHFHVDQGPFLTCR